jgi:hypothetical protein
MDLPPWLWLWLWLWLLLWLCHATCGPPWRPCLPLSPGGAARVTPVTTCPTARAGSGPGLMSDGQAAGRVRWWPRRPSAEAVRRPHGTLSCFNTLSWLHRDNVPWLLCVLCGCILLSILVASCCLVWTGGPSAIPHSSITPPLVHTSRRSGLRRARSARRTPHSTRRTVGRSDSQVSRAGYHTALTRP